jgi:predicted nuclease of predicted toxin-antitoxin system
VEFDDPTLVLARSDRIRQFAARSPPPLSTRTANEFIQRLSASFSGPSADCRSRPSHPRARRASQTAGRRLSQSRCEFQLGSLGTHPLQSFSSERGLRQHWSAIGDGRASDREIFEWASRNGFVVFTHDLDFGRLLALTGSAGPSVVLLRTLRILPTETAGTIVRSFGNKCLISRRARSWSWIQRAREYVFCLSADGRNFPDAPEESPRRSRVEGRRPTGCWAHAVAPRSATWRAPRLFSHWETEFQLALIVDAAAGGRARTLPVDDGLHPPLGVPPLGTAFATGPR